MADGVKNTPEHESGRQSGEKQSGSPMRPENSARQEETPSLSSNKPKHFKEGVEVSGRSIAKIASLPISLSEAPQVAVSQEIMDDIRRVLVEAGLEKAKVDAMPDELLAVEADFLIKEAIIKREEKLTSDEELVLKVAEAYRNSAAPDLDPHEVKKKLLVTKQSEMQSIAAREGAQVVGNKSKPHVVVETKKRIEYSSYDELIALLKAKKIEVEPPSKEKWEEEWSVIHKDKWRRENSILDFADWGEKYSKKTYVEQNGDRVTIVGAQDLSSETIHNLLAQEGITKKITYPANFHKMGPKAQAEFLKSQGVDIVWGISGGAVNWTDPEKMDVERENRRTGMVETVAVDIDFNERIRRLMELKSEHADVAGHALHDQWQTLQTGLVRDLARIQAAKVGKGDFEFVAKTDTSIKELLAKYELIGRTADLDSILSKDKRDEISAAKKSIDNHYISFEKSKKPEELALLFKTIDEEAAQVIQVQRSGFYGKAQDQRDHFDRVAEREIVANPDPMFVELLKWRAQRHREGFDQAYGEITLQQPSGIWKDSKKNLDTILRYLESTDFTEQQLGQALNHATAIVQAIPVDALIHQGLTKEAQEAQEVQKALTERLNAVLEINRFFGTMENADMNPEAVIKAFSGFQDYTFQRYFERFKEDSNGKAFKDSTGAEIKDFNLLNAGMGVYMGRFARERKVMNFVEEWTKNTAINGTTDEEKAAVGYIRGHLNEVYGGVYSFANIKDSVWAWYREKTFLGSAVEKAEREKHDFEKTGGSDDDEEFEYGLEPKKRELVSELREVLMSKYNMSKRQVDDMANEGLVNQVINNGHRLAWMFAWSDYDGVRIWDPNAETPVGHGRVAEYIFNENTHMFHGRMLDHPFDFYINENRGKVGKTNWLMQKAMLGKHGNLLPQNRTMVRFAGRLFGATGDAARAAWGKSVSDKIKQLDNIDRLDVDGFAPDREWAQSAAASELIDEGEVSFENADWSKFFDSQGSWKYLMIDLYADRNAMMKYISADVLQKYLQTPNSALFSKINTIEMFYSKREMRIKPWCKLAAPVHMEMGQKWRKWWGLDDNMGHGEKEDIIEALVQSNRIEREYRDWMKHRYLSWGPMPGITPVRRGRQLAQVAGFRARERGVKDSWQYPFVGGGVFGRELFKYLTK
ncbi:MAG: hypothetical protein AAB512_05150 [Patescibacteria group bacterium]